MLERHLAPAGFSVDRPVFSEAGSEPVENLFAAIGERRRATSPSPAMSTSCRPAPKTRWRHPPFAAEIVDGVLYGRGAVDMKGGLAAMVAAALRFVARRGADFGGRLSFLVTGDEEGAAVNGTAKLLEWAAARGERFTAALVGEPTSARELGDQIKIGRRGSFSATLVVEGTQGHAAYPELADNPVRGLTQLLYALQSAPLDDGLGAFRPVVAGGRQRRCRQPGLERHSGEGDGALQQPLQRSLDARDAAGGDRAAARRRGRRSGACRAKLPIRWRLVAGAARRRMSF